MKSTRTFTTVLSLAIALALPAVAGAGVKDDLGKASSSLERAASAATQEGNAAKFLTAANANRKQTAKAQRKATREPKKLRRAKLLRQVAAQHNANVLEYANLIALAPPEIQELIVEAVAISAEAREQALAMLLELAETLPEPARGQVLAAIAAFDTDGDIEALLAALTSDDVIASVKVLIQEQIESLSAHLDSVIAQLEELTGMLPPQAAAAISAVLDRLEQNLDQISDLITGLLDQLGSIPSGNGLPGAGLLCDLLGPFVPLPICD